MTTKLVGVKVSHRGSDMFMTVDQYESMSNACMTLDDEDGEQYRWDTLEYCDYWNDDLHEEDPDYS